MSRRRYAELHPESGRVEPPAGAIRDVQLRGIIARGKSRCLLRGHPEQWMQGLRLDGVRLYLSADPRADYNKEGSGLIFRHCRDVELHHVSVELEEPGCPKVKSALSFEDAADVLVEGFHGKLAPESKEPAISLKNVAGAVVRNCRVDPENATLLLAGVGTKDVIVGTGVMPPSNDVEREAQTLRPQPVERPPRAIVVKPARKTAPARPAPRKPAAKKSRASAPAARARAAGKPRGKSASGKPGKKR